MFHFYGNGLDTSNALEGCFTMAGHVDRATGRVDLRGERWLLHPTGYVTVDLHGSIKPGGIATRSNELNLMDGTVAGPGCSWFGLLRLGALSYDHTRSPSACYAAPLS